MRDFYIVDTTLRDGEQTPGVVFLKKEKIKIARMLDELGVDYIEAGIPIMGEEEKDVIREIIAMNGKAKILTWNRMKKMDVDASLACGAKYIHIAVPASDIHIFQKLRKDRKWVIQQVQEVVSYGAEKGCIVSVGAEDASRAEEKFLIEIYQAAIKEGAVRLRYADTLGILTPITTYQAIKRICDYIDADLEFHGHNDFGMATANSLSAFQAGAKYIDCSVNGLGERAGNTALEEIVMTLKYLLKSNHPFEIKRILELSNIVQEASRKIVGESKPIVGKSVFSHESGIHVDGLLKNPTVYESFSPGEIGRKRKIVLGKHSGRTTVIYRLQEMGIKVTPKEANEIIEMIHKKYTYDKNPNIDHMLQQWVELKRDTYDAFSS
ncbi:pyruvate carboxyltransferase [Alkaliphilus metalliredigens QYMF]|uniref:Pyruvate carboxyltransferase n=1 Tax=Alkaliphilus metalliredigens (strain QYMF) TaxID=293826 RepID=A6TTX4_ALKMQ|nr:homocitrate synthase [Alkaliphilus metalliredigens]ABR49642.1 pyruvate carboxyltransferase [Alkaliphilus metalliredigens QYMF]